MFLSFRKFILNFNRRHWFSLFDIFNEKPSLAVEVGRGSLKCDLTQFESFWILIRTSYICIEQHWPHSALNIQGPPYPLIGPFHFLRCKNKDPMTLEPFLRTFFMNLTFQIFIFLLQRNQLVPEFPQLNDEIALERQLQQQKCHERRTQAWQAKATAAYLGLELVLFTALHIKHSPQAFVLLVSVDVGFDKLLRGALHTQLRNTKIL